MKRKGRLLLFMLLLITVLSGCGRVWKNEKALSKDSKKLQIVTTIFPLYDFISEVGGDKAEVHMLLKPGMESHSYEPSPQDMIAVLESDLFFYIGGESDVWVEELLDGMEYKNAHALIETVEAVTEETPEGAFVKGHRHGEHEEEEYDEHIWTSPKKAITIVKYLEETLCRADSENASVYQKNAENYLNELEKLNQDYTKVIKEGDKKVMIFGDRFPFRYLAEDYGLSYYAAFPGCSSETEPNAGTIAFLVKKVREEQLPVVFYLELSNPNIAEAIAETAGAKEMRFHSCHNVTKEEMNAGATYISLMRENLEHLKEAME